MSDSAQPAPAPEAAAPPKSPPPLSAADWWTPIRNIGPEMIRAWREARNGIEAIDRSGENTHDGYKYSSMKDFADAVESGLSKQGLVVIVEAVTARHFPMLTSREKKVTACHVLIRGHVYHESGQSLPFQFPGEAYDWGDKASYKSTTGARKYALCCLFNLKGGTDPEEDSFGERQAAREAAAGDGSAEAKSPAGKHDRPKRGPSEPPPAKQTNPPPANGQAEPKKQTTADLIKASKTAAGLATLLQERVGQYPVAKYSDKWPEYLRLAEQHMTDAKWAEKNQAAVLAVIYGIRAQLATVAAGPGTEGAAPAAAAPADGRKPDIQTLEALAGWIEDQATPDDLLALLGTLETSPTTEPIRSHPTRFREAVDHVKTTMEYRLHKQEWTEDDCDPLVARLAAIEISGGPEANHG